MEIRQKIVDFTFCRFCKNKSKKEYEEPCNDCLDNPTNTESKRPIHFKDNGSFEKLQKARNKKNLKGE